MMQTLTQLPTHEEAAEALAAGNATALHRFIHDQEPAGPHDEEFRTGLAAALAEARTELSPAGEQSGEAVAWVRFRSDGGYEGPIMDCDKRMDGSRRTSGAWTPLGIIRQPAPATAEDSSVDQQALAAPDGCRDVLFGNFDALEAAADAVEACGMNGYAEGVRAVRHALSMLAAAPQPVNQLSAVIEEIAQQWGSCIYDSPSGDIDIGQAIRAAGKRLVSEQQEGGGDAQI